MKESVGILIIARDTHNFLLLHRVSKPKVWSILTGTMDKVGETPLKCLKREIKEEIRIEPSLVKNIKKLGVVKDKFKTFHFFIGYVDNELELDLKTDENDDYIWTNENNLPTTMHREWPNSFQIFKNSLKLKESIKTELKNFLHEQGGLGNRTGEKENFTG